MSATASAVLKSAYVKAVRVAAGTVARSGLGRVLERRTGRRSVRWLGSLGAIHDIDAMVALDVPWWTYRAIETVERFLADRPGAAVFEYGSGASTAWLARRAGTVTSIEHDAAWYGETGRVVAGAAHVDLRLCPPDPPGAYDPAFRSGKPGAAHASFRRYVEAIGSEGPGYDLIVIDGRARAACLAAAVDRLAPGGLIVLDNSERRRYRAAVAAAVARGFVAERLRGLVPALPYPGETTLLRRPDSRP